MVNNVRTLPSGGTSSPSWKGILKTNLAGVGLHGVVGQVDEQLGEAALSSRVIAQDG
jgi:hypothetical protein